MTRPAPITRWRFSLRLLIILLLGVPPAIAAACFFTWEAFRFRDAVVTEEVIDGKVIYRVHSSP